MTKIYSKITLLPFGSDFYSADTRVRVSTHFILHAARIPLFSHTCFDNTAVNREPTKKYDNERLDTRGRYGFSCYGTAGPVG